MKQDRNIPGARLPSEVERNLIRDIRAKWNVPLVNYFGPREFRPASLWSRLPMESPESDRSILNRIVAEDDRYFLYIEDPYPGMIYEAELKEIVEDLLGIAEYGFRASHYIIPKTMNWLVAHTDEEIKSGHLVLLDGPVPLAAGGPSLR